MIKKKAFITILMILVLAVSGMGTVLASGTDYDGDINQVYANVPARSSAYEQLRKQYQDTPSWYCYTLRLNVTNPFNSSEGEYKQVGKFQWKFSYRDRNGYGDSHTYTLDMSWNSSGSRLLNKELFNEMFARKNDNEYSKDMIVWLPGTLESINVQLDMDGAGFMSLSGERVSVTVEEVRCGKTVINANTDYVSSVFYLSEAKIRCEMPETYAAEIDGNSLARATAGELERIIAGLDSSSDIRDQYGSKIELGNLDNVMASQGSINQNIDHSDEPGMYLYTLKMRVRNPVDLTTCGTDAVEDFRFTFTYLTDNGLGSRMTYDLELAKGCRYHNKEILSKFMTRGSSAYDLDLDLWIPGILEKVDVLLNMNGGEELTVAIQSIECSGRRVSEKPAEVSSSYYDDTATVKCHMEHGMADLSKSVSSQRAAISKIRSYGRNTDITDEQLEMLNSGENTYILSSDPALEGVACEDVTDLGFSTYAPWNAAGKKEENDKTFWCTKELIKLNTMLENTFTITGRADCYIQFALVSTEDRSVSMLTDERLIDSGNYSVDLNDLAMSMAGFKSGSYEVGINFRYDPDSSVPKAVRTSLTGNKDTVITVKGSVQVEQKTSLVFEKGLQWLDDASCGKAGNNVCSSSEKVELSSKMNNVMHLGGLNGAYIGFVFLDTENNVILVPDMHLGSGETDIDLGMLFNRSGGSGNSYSVLINIYNPMAEEIRDQYGSLATERLIEAASENPELYIYEYSLI